jgi:hypothetical protein
MTKYENAKQLVRKIIESGIESLNCETILKTRSEWTLNKNEFNAEQEFRKYLSSNQNKRSFLYSLISFVYNPFF